VGVLSGQMIDPKVYGLERSLLPRKRRVPGEALARGVSGRGGYRGCPGDS
jgi:hypothetical protein